MADKATFADIEALLTQRRELDELSKLEDLARKFKDAQPISAAEKPSDYSCNHAIPQGQPAFNPLAFPSPLHLLLVICPELTPHKWQAELELQLGGFLDPSANTRSEITAHKPFILCLPAANGSGKDQFIIATFAVWFALCGIRNRVIITSSSWEQVKYQTENHIKYMIKAANTRFGPVFESVEFYHTCPLTGSEIKLFATDDEGKAEGYHPFPEGRMALIINEAKSVSDKIFDALARCTGYSYWLEVSSPAGKSGHFYESSRSAVTYPALPILGQTYLRHVSAYDCPHIPQTHIEFQKRRMSEWWFKSSILALFTDYGEDVVITEDMWEKAVTYPPAQQGDDIVIGLDLAAGQAENACFVRKGNIVIDSFSFVQRDTFVTSELIDARLSLYRHIYTQFISDDGGVSRAIVDNLVHKGWRISRRLNQSPARNKREYLNLGAEMWFHIRKLILNRLIVLPTNDPTFHNQLTTRYYDQQASQGKFGLESKADAAKRSKVSPDRADAFVLCFSSYRIPRDDQSQPAATPHQIESIAALERRYIAEKRQRYVTNPSRSIARVRL